MHIIRRSILGLLLVLGVAAPPLAAQTFRGGPDDGHAHIQLSRPTSNRPLVPTGELAIAEVGAGRWNLRLPRRTTARCELYDAVGKRCLTQDFTSETQLDLRPFAPGTYLLLVRRRSAETIRWPLVLRAE